VKFPEKKTRVKDILWFLARTFCSVRPCDFCTLESKTVSCNFIPPFLHASSYEHSRRSGNESYRWSPDVSLSLGQEWIQAKSSEQDCQFKFWSRDSSQEYMKAVRKSVVIHVDSCTRFPDNWNCKTSAVATLLRSVTFRCPSVKDGAVLCIASSFIHACASLTWHCCVRRVSPLMIHIISNASYREPHSTALSVATKQVLSRFLRHFLVNRHRLIARILSTCRHWRSFRGGTPVTPEWPDHLKDFLVNVSEVFGARLTVL